MRSKKRNNGIFILFVVIAVVIAAVVICLLPTAVNEWKQLIFFGTVIAVTAVLIAVYKIKKN